MVLHVKPSNSNSSLAFHSNIDAVFNEPAIHTIAASHCSLQWHNSNTLKCHLKYHEIIPIHSITILGH